MTTTLAQDRFSQPIQALGIGVSVDVSLSTSASTAMVSAVGSGTMVVRLVSDTDCWVAIGEAPVAASGGLRLLGGAAEYFAIRPGQRVAGRAISVAGTLNVVEMD